MREDRRRARESCARKDKQSAHSTPPTAGDARQRIEHRLRVEAREEDEAVVTRLVAEKRRQMARDARTSAQAKLHFGAGRVLRTGCPQDKDG